MVGGDCLEIAVELGPRAAALVTTPSAQKLYRSKGPKSIQNVRLEIAGGATLEWLPGETLVFDGANAKLCTHVELAEGAAFIGWEIGCFGRPAGGLPFVRGTFLQSFQIARRERPLLLERLRVEGGSPVLTAPWGYAGATSYGTLYAVPRASGSLSELADRLRASAAFSSADWLSVTVLDELLVVRALGVSVEAVRNAFVEVWALIRQEVIGRPACAPRIWAT
jgi:urease accessory protein